MSRFDRVGPHARGRSNPVNDRRLGWRKTRMSALPYRGVGVYHPPASIPTMHARASTQVVGWHGRRRGSRAGLPRRRRG